MASRPRRQTQSQLQPKFEIGDKLRIELPNVSDPSIYLVVDRQMKESTIQYMVVPEANSSILIQDSQGKLTVENSTQGFRIEKVLTPVSEIQTEIPVDQFEILPGDILFEIGLNINLEQIPRYCQLSRRFNQEVCAKDSFWQRKLDREFPNRIQKESRKLGPKNYLFWLDRARRGLIEPQRLDGHLIDLKERETFTIKPEVSIKYAGNYQIFEFDRFGYYPDYYFRVKNLETGKIHQMMIYNKRFTPLIFEDDLSTLIDENRIVHVGKNRRMDLNSAFRGLFQILGNDRHAGIYQIDNKQKNEDLIVFTVKNLDTSQTKKLFLIIIDLSPIVFDNDWFHTITSTEVFNFFEFSTGLAYPILLRFEGPPDVWTPDQFNASGNDVILTLKFHPLELQSDLNEEFFEFKIKYDRSYEITQTPNYNKYLTPEEEKLVGQMIDLAFKALPEHVGRYLRWIEILKAHPNLENLIEQDEKVLDQLGWW